MDEPQKIRDEIIKNIKQYFNLVHAKKQFIPGKSKVSYAGRVYDEEEMVAAIDSILEFWLTIKDKNTEFSNEFSKFLNVNHTLLVNSGSSANLLAMSALRSNMLEKQIKLGEEVITPAMTFSTCINPIIQNGLVPVVVDSEVGTYNINVNELEKAYSKKTKAIMIPHILGNPCDMDPIMDFAKERDLFVIEDSCDALQSKYGNKYCGTIGDLGTFSFYAAHHIFMGEGGAVTTNNEDFYKILKSLRDWGRVAQYEEDSKMSFNERFGFKIGDLNYDARYFFTTIGYNLKPLDLQAAIGLAQLKKVSSFTEHRKNNFNKMYKELSKYDEFILPRKADKADPSWFAFTITVDTDKFTRLELMEFLEKSNIQTRFPFAGNITKHPAYKDTKMRVVGSLEGADRIMKDSFFIGVFPGINKEMLDYTINKFHEFMSKY